MLLSEEEVEARDGSKPAAGKRYFKHTTLDDIIIHYSIMRGTTDEERKKETLTRIVFVDFLRGLMEFDPVKRWTPQQVRTAATRQRSLVLFSCRPRLESTGNTS